MVLVKRRQIRVAQEVLNNYLCSWTEFEGTVDFSTLFGNSHPVEIEVGFGKGLFLISAARSNPGTNYFGIEISAKCAALTAGRLHEADIDHVRLVLADARQVFARGLVASRVQAVHTYFPDPWWKRRHKKRRLYTPGFVRDLHRVLSPGGALHLWTDVEEYFRSACEIIEQCPGLVPCDVPAQRPPSHDMDYHTHFERKTRRGGDPVFRARYVKL